MRYWKGLPGSQKEGFFGTMDDTGIVPDSIEATLLEYDAYIASIPVIPEKDFKDLYSKAMTADARIALLAENAGLI